MNLFRRFARSWPAPVLSLLAASLHAATITNIATGEFHGLFLNSTGAFLGMGFNEDGELGDGTGNNVFVPETILPSGVVKISGGGSHTLFLKSDGSLWGMGFNGDGELGDGTTSNHLSPIQIVSTGVIAIAAGDSHSLFIKNDGSLWGMGYNHDGELGDGTTNNHLSPVMIVSSGVTNISAGFDHSLFLKTNGALFAMGRNNFGQLGDGTTTDRHSPVMIVASNMIAVAAGNQFSLFLKNSGLMSATGHNDFGQLGFNSTASISSPLPITSPVVAIAAGGHHSLFITSGGHLFAMGDNGDGQLGGSTNARSLVPIQIVSSGVTSIGAGEFHSLFLKSDGTLWGMGFDADGELGDGGGADVFVAKEINSFLVLANPTSGPAPLAVNFTSASVDLYGNTLTNWSWDFGDGSLGSSAQNPSHIYPEQGVFSQVVHAIGTGGVPSAGVGPAINATGLVANGGFETGDFTGWTNSPKAAVAVDQQFTDFPAHSGNFYASINGTDTLGQILTTQPGTSYLLSCWLLDDFDPFFDTGTNQFLVSWGPNTAVNISNVNPVDVPLGYVNYQFVLPATASSTALQFSFNPNDEFWLDDVSVSPLAATVNVLADKTNGPFPLTVHFTSPPTDSAGHTITNWDWNFGDGSAHSPSQNPVHTYSNRVDTFTPLLLAQDNSGAVAAGAPPAISVQLPTVQFTAVPTNGAAPFNVQFTCPSTDSGGSAITNWNWDFGDLGTSTNQDPLHAYVVQGMLVPTLTATNSFGLPVIASGPPFIFSSGLISNPSFENFDTNSGDVDDWTTQLTVNNFVAHSGTYSLEFFGNGSTASQTLSTTPGAGYLVSFWLDDLSEFQGASFIASWNGSIIFNQTNTPRPFTNFTVFVQATGTNSVLQFESFFKNTGGGIFLDDVSVTPAEVETFTATPASGPIFLPVEFNSPTKDSFSQTITAWQWDFGDGSPTSPLQNPAHTYTNVGTFTVTLTATNNLGAPVPGPSGVTITTSLPTVTASASVTNGSDPLAVQFTTPSVDNSGKTITSWNWNFTDGFTAAAQNPSHTYFTDSGAYAGAPPFEPVLSATNSDGIPVIGIVPPINVTYNPGLVINGGFETDDFTGWTTNGFIEIVFANTHTGELEAEFTSGPATLAQTIPTTPGASYVFSFSLLPFAGRNAIFPAWNGTTLMSLTNLPPVNNAPIPWTNFQFTVMATNTASVIQFSFNPPGSFPVEFLDDVSVFALPPAAPAIAGVLKTGNNLILNGAGGSAGAACIVLTSTNSALPFNQWTPFSTNTLGQAGNFTLTLTNAISASAPKRFFVLQFPQ